MTDLDMKSDDGLRAACAEAERALDPNRIAQVAKFLAEVAAVPPEDRGSPEFQRQIWRTNPIITMPDRLGAAVEAAAFGAWFRDEWQDALPKDFVERREVLWERFRRVVNRKPILFRSTDGIESRQWMFTRRAFCGLFRNISRG